MRVTSKGQVTIPQDIRERFGLLPSTEVEFVVEGKTVRLRRAKGVRQARGVDVVRRLVGRASGGMSTDEIMALTRRA